jgi:hypothetical protein
MSSSDPLNGAPNPLVDTVRRLVDFSEGPGPKNPKPHGREAKEVGSGLVVPGTGVTFIDLFNLFRGAPQNPVFRQSYETTNFAFGGIPSRNGGPDITRTGILNAFLGTPVGRAAANDPYGVSGLLSALTRSQALATVSTSGAGSPPGAIALWHQSLQASPPTGWTVIPGSQYATWTWVGVPIGGIVLDDAYSWYRDAINGTNNVTNVDNPAKIQAPPPGFVYIVKS